MPAYVNTPFRVSPKILQPGMPTYLWGHYDHRTTDTTGPVISNSAVTTTATLTFQIMSGNIPAIGALISVVGAANSANFNADKVAIISVSTTISGVCTVTYAITSTSQATLPDSGFVVIPQPEIAEALAAGSSERCAMPYGNATFNQNQGLTAVVSFPSLPTSVIVSLQQAVNDIDAEYAMVAVAATVAGGVVTVGGQITVDPTLGRFFRFSNGTVVGGTLPTVIAKLLM